MAEDKKNSNDHQNDDRSNDPNNNQSDHQNNETKEKIGAGFPVRKKNYTFDSSISRHWFANEGFITHFFNSLNVVFPAGEKFFIKAIKSQLEKHRDKIDKQLLEDCKAFIGQEMQHYSQHEKFLEILRQQGYKFDDDIQNVTAITEFFINNAPGKLNLAMVAGFEHYTAMFANLALESKVLDVAQEPLKILFEWHAAEELEHKAVAFDLLKAVDDNYLLRVAGMFGASAILWSLMAKVTYSLVKQDGELFQEKTYKGLWRIFFGEHNLLPKSLLAFIHYFRPDFHPNDVDDKALAKEVFTRHAGNVEAA